MMKSNNLFKLNNQNFFVPKSFDVYITCTYICENNHTTLQCILAICITSSLLQFPCEWMHVGEKAMTLQLICVCVYVISAMQKFLEK